MHCRFLVPGNTQKILTEIWHHFWLKMMVKSGLEKIILKFHGGLQRYLLTCQANSAFLGRFFCTGQQQLWRPSWNFKIIFSRPLFTIIFKPKMVSNLRRIFCVLHGTKNLVVCLLTWLVHIRVAWIMEFHVPFSTEYWHLIYSFPKCLSIKAYGMVSRNTTKIPNGFNVNLQRSFKNKYEKN